MQSIETKRKNEKATREKARRDFIDWQKAGKNQLVVRLGKKNAVKGYIAIISLAYISIVIGVVIELLGIMDGIPVWSLITLVTIPLAFKSIKTTTIYYNNPKKLIPANAMTIQVHTLTGILLCCAYLPTIFGITIF